MTLQNRLGGVTPVDTLRNNDVVITPKRRHFDVITSKWRFDVITTLLLRQVFGGNISTTMICYKCYTGTLLIGIWISADVIVPNRRLAITNHHAATTITYGQRLGQRPDISQTYNLITYMGSCIYWTCCGPNKWGGRETANDFFINGSLVHWKRKVSWCQFCRQWWRWGMGS